MEGLVFALLDTSAAIPDEAVAAKLRDLTISWSRFKYFGPILEGADLDGLLRRAALGGHRFCLVQAWGHVLQEVWSPETHGGGDFLAALERWTAGRDFLAAGNLLVHLGTATRESPEGSAGRGLDPDASLAGPDLATALDPRQAAGPDLDRAPTGSSGSASLGPTQVTGYGLDPACLLVALECYRRLGLPAFGAPGRPPAAMQGMPAMPAMPEMPLAELCRDAEGASLVPGSGEAPASPALPGWNLVRRSLEAGLPVYDFPHHLAEATARLAPGDEAAAARLRSWLGDGIAGLDPAEAASLLGGRAAGFLATVQTLVSNLRRGVFVWNVESYDDVREPPPDFSPPLTTLYSVAAGLKPNWMLEAHGFDERTHVVYYDYSEAGLEFRKLLLAEWDGEDYPGFLRRLFRRLPPSRAYYCLWDGATPDNLDWDDVEARWRQEIERWGGASALSAHWARYRRLRHEHVHCNLLSDPAPLLATVRDEPSAVIWWSNAFFSVYSNWHLDARRREQIYRRWIERLADRAPRLFLYGATSNNVSVNFVRAAEYRDWYRAHAGDELEPGKLHRVELRF